MPNWKQAAADASEHGYACYDLPSGEHVTLAKDEQGYNLEGRVDGTRVILEGSEEGFPHMLEEMNINPSWGWYSL